MNDMIGHNLPTIDLGAALDPASLKPWLDAQLQPHADRTAELMAAYERFLIVTKDGVTEELAPRAADFERQFKEALTALDRTRKTIKDPVLHAQRLIDGEAKTLADKLTTAAQTINARLTRFLVAKEAAAREAAAREAARLDAEAQAALEALKNAPDDSVVEEAAMAAFKDAGEAVALAEAKPADLTRFHTPNAGVASLRRVWKVRVTDISKVPSAYLMVNQGMLDAALKAAPKAADGTPTLNIPGVEVFAENKATVR